MDASAASENLLLAAHAVGLGAVWTGVYPRSERVKAVRTILGLPESVVPLNVIPIGYPAQTPEPKQKWNPGNIPVSYTHLDVYKRQDPPRFCRVRSLK